MRHPTAAILLFAACPLFGQTPAPAQPTAPFKDVRLTATHPGDALVDAEGKTRRVARDVWQVWPVMKGENALLLIRGPHSAPGTARLRYIEGESMKGRDLGDVPFTQATFHEQDLPGNRVAFLLVGAAGNTSTLIVADTLSIHAEIKNATDPVITGSTLTWRAQAAGGARTESETKSIPLISLVALDLPGINASTPDSPGDVAYAQFNRDGAGYVIDREGKGHRGDWRTDGPTFTVEETDAKEEVIHRYEIARSTLTPVEGVPASTRLTVRLLQPLSSVTAHEGDAVDAVLISPANMNGKLYLPQGAHFIGAITKATKVGWAVPHETAALTVEFTSVKFDDGTTLPLRARLYQVDNAREKVSGEGKIEGIRSTGTIAHNAESKIASVAALEPMSYLFTTVSATSLLGFAEPEILYNAGTELVVELDSPLVTSKTFPEPIPALATTPDEQKQLSDFVQLLPFRTMTKGTNKPSDLTNLVFIGKPDALLRAFEAAGWKQTDELTASSTFQTMKTLGGTSVYTEAPMSVLKLDEQPPIYTLSKTTNTFNSRHHTRIFDIRRQYRSVTVLTASATQDIGIGFSAKQKTFIHIIDQYIDNERSKIVDDLEFTGCVEAAQTIDRPNVPKDASNSTGDRLRTDGAVIVLRMTSCDHPHTTTVTNAVPPPRFERIVRDTVLTIRNDLVRGNVGYQGYEVTRWSRNYWIHRNDLKPDSGAWLKADVSGETFKGRGDVSSEQQPGTQPFSHRTQDEIESQTQRDPETIAARESHRWDPPRYEIGLQGGYLIYPNPRVQAVLLQLTPTDPINNPGDYFTVLADQVDGGWSAGIYVIANTWKWLSNEFSYNYQRGKYEAINLSASGEGEDLTLNGYNVGLVTRQFEYNLLLNLRPPRSRWRPYIAVGPALQLISLDGAVFKKPSGPFRLGLQSVGILKAAFDFGSTPPLDGGGIYQLGLQYGAGIKFRVLPHFTINADFRETWAKSPDFIRDSYTDEYFADEDYNLETLKVGSESKFRQQRFTLGFAFTF